MQARSWSECRIWVAALPEPLRRVWIGESQPHALQNPVVGAVMP
jgi:hypothetical protein